MTRQSRSAIKDFFIQETRGFTNSLNSFSVSQITRTGREVQNFGNKKMQGASVINPIKSLFRNGKLSQGLHDSIIDYQVSYERSCKTNHARPSYEGGIGRSTKLEVIEPSQSQLESSSMVSKVHSELSKHKKDIIDLRSKKISARVLYIDVLKDIIEKEVSINNFSKKHKLNPGTASRILIDVCELVNKIKKTS